MRRGEARTDSDIDVVIVLETLTRADLSRLRILLDSLPEGDRAHGFSAGRRELAAWPRYELFGFVADIQSYFGDLDSLIPEISDADIAAGISANAAAVYHAVAHTYTAATGSNRTDELRASLGPLLKSFYFALVLVEYARTRRYPKTRAELESRVDGVEKRLLTVDIAGERDIDDVYDALLRWSSSQLTTSS